MGMNITSYFANTDEEGYALLKEFGLPFKNAKTKLRYGKRINEGSRVKRASSSQNMPRRSRTQGRR